MKSNPFQDPLCKVTAIPRAKAKVEARARGNIQETGTTTRTRLDLRRKIDSARWVILVLYVKELNLSVISKSMIILRVPVWIEQLMCFAFKSADSVTMDSTELPSSSKRVSDGSEEPGGIRENFDQSTVREVLFRRWMSR